MASTHKSLRSGTANKRPTTSIADGQIALNTNTTSPGLFFKDSTGATIIKVGPVHVGTTAPNASPAAGGSAGNSVGEIWLDTSLTPVGVKIWNGSAFVNATPIGSTTVQGLLELATNAETQTGTDPDRAVTPAGLQSKVSDSTSTTSSTTIASSTAVKSAYDLANAALPKSGGTVTGNLEIGTTGSLSFEGATADAFETTIAVVDPTADRTITLPDTTGTVVTTGDTGTVTSTMIADGTIVNGDINASAAIDHSKLANITAGSVLLGNASNVPTATALSGDVTVNSTGVTAISSGVIVNADVNASAAIAGTKISPDFGSQTITTTGVVSAALGAAATPSLTFTGDLNTGIYSPGADQVAISTGGSGRLFVDSSGRTLVGTSTARALTYATPRFQVEGSGFPSAHVQIFSTSNNTEGAYLTLGHSRGAAWELLQNNDTIGRIDFAAGDGVDDVWAGAIGCFVDGTPGSNDMPTRLTFSTTADGASSPTERLRITSAGLVGVGTSTPGYPLTVNGRISYAGAIGEGADTTLSSSSTTLIVGESATWQNLALRTNGNTRLYINSSGSVGIGTSSPSKLLTIGTSSTANTTVRLNCSQTAGSDTGMYSFGIDDSTDFAGMRLDFTDRTSKGLQIFTAPGFGYPISFSGSSGNQDVTIDASGRVGIGTTSPQADLHIGNADGASRSIVIHTINNGDARLRFREGSTVGSGYNEYSFGMAGNANAMTWESQGLGEIGRWDSSGRLLVGTSSARSNFFNSSSFSPALQLEGTNDQGRLLSVIGSNTGGAGGVLVLASQKSGTVGGNTIVTDGGQLGLVSFQGSDGTEFVEAARIQVEVDGTPGANDMPGRLVFSTTKDGASSPVERFRINNAGLFAMVADAGDAFYLGANAGAGTANYLMSLRHTATAGTMYSGTECLKIFTNGNVQNTNGSYTTLSDIKLKENIVDAGSQWDDLKAIQIRNWNFKAETGHETHRQIGPIAQELETVCPGLVFETPDRDEDGNETGEVTKSVNQSVLYMKAVKALQEAMERIEQLEAKVAALESA